jgi:hypothetical protein
LTLELKVHPSFFKEFATKTWISPYEIIRELVENAFDEDATKVIVTVLSDGNVVVEDDAGMNFDSINKFLILGTPHKSNENLSPKLKRIRTGRYGTGRLSFLTSFDNMKIKTKLDDFNRTLIINGEALEHLFKGRTQLQELHESPLKRNGTEIFLKHSKIHIDISKLSKELKKLSILKYPLFEVYIKTSELFNEWDLTDSQIIKSPDVQGYKIVVNIPDVSITGEIVIAKRPLSHDEKGIAIMVGNHVVLRSSFGFDNKLHRVTGYVKCDQLTSRFADKSALIENDMYFKFNQSMKDFIISQVFPSLSEYEDVLITREESKIYKEIDKVMGQAVLEMLQVDEEVQGYESVEVSSGIEEDNSNIISSQSIDKQQPQQPQHYRFSSTNSSEQQGKMNKEADNYSQNIKENYPNALNYPSENDPLKSVNNDLMFQKLPMEKICDEEISTTRFKNAIDNKMDSKFENFILSDDNGSNNNSLYEQQQQNICKIKDTSDTTYSHKQQSFVIPQQPSNGAKKNEIDDNLAFTSTSTTSTSTSTSQLLQPSQQQQSSPLLPPIYSSPNSQQQPSQSTPQPTQNEIDGDDYHQYLSTNKNESSLIKKTVRKPILKKTFTLKKIGYKVIPYEDETDSRYSFTNDNLVFVNKAHSTYKAESDRGDEFLFRHITNIVAEVVVGSKYPEARDILEIQNKLISEAIKIHDHSLIKK